MYIKKVTSYADALDMRDIRNECRKQMTNDTRKIGYIRQLWWWHKNKNKVEAFLLCFHVIDHVVGYGVIRGNTFSGGVVKFWRGYGFGRQIFSFLTRCVPKPAYLEVKKNNIVAQRLYESLGWEYDAKQDDSQSFYTMTHE